MPVFDTQGPDCRNPLGRLHPSGEVTTIQQALDPKWDALYASLQPFSFKDCSTKYLDWSAEGVDWLTREQARSAP